MTHVPLDPPLQLPSSWQWHAPAMHWNPSGHARPQAPQLKESVARLEHPAGFWQHVWPAEHALAPLHEQLSTCVVPASMSASSADPSSASTSPASAATGTVVVTHDSPAWHARPLHEHSPLRLHAPATPPHEADDGHPQLEEALHTNPPATPCAVQSLPQLPQPFADWAGVSHPSSGLGAAGALQLEKPRVQLGTQTPPAQIRAPTFWPEQARPH
jgi:hypothetical protein